MEKETTKQFSKESLDFLNKYFLLSNDDRNIKNNNEKTINSALIYEKLRVAVEYQEEHLIFKNAVARIFRRKYTLTPNITAEKLLADLVSELSWANYLNPELLKKDETSKIKSTLNRYLILLKYSQSRILLKNELQKTIVNWAACEIIDIIHPHPEFNVLIDYAYSVLNNNLVTKGTKISDEDNKLQLELAIFNLVYKPDLSLIQYRIIQKIYPGWRNYTKEESMKFALSFDPNNNAINKIINNPYRKRYLQYAKRNITPFILIKNLAQLKDIDIDVFRKDPELLNSNLMRIYDTLIVSSKNKVWRGTLRALIFILITKISLALILEVPVEKYFIGAVYYPALIINISLPPIIMLIAGTFVKSPPSRNRNVVSETINSILFDNKIDNKNFSLLPRKLSYLDIIFNYVYFVFTIAILVLVIWGLVVLKFNILSITLFFLFMSAVSFFSFRIRGIALELAMKTAKEDSITSTIEFIMLPFIRIGKFISEKLSKTNPFTSFLDFLIEAPLKMIIKIFNSWFKFVNTKKEEIQF